jgi:iron complex transport system substrate-binding protein
VVILPGTGRGTATRSGGVEGHVPQTIRLRHVPLLHALHGPPPPRGRNFCVLLALALAACAAAPQTEQVDGPTIVSLNPCADAILAEVAEPGQLLAISHYSHDPRATSMPLAAARRFASTGGTVEEVLALDPDVVVAGAFLPPATAHAFERLGIRVETFAITASVADSLAQVRQLAMLAGHRQRGEALTGRIEAALAQSRRDGPKVPALLWQGGGIVPGEATLIAELLAHTGFASHSAARGLGQGAYVPLERVLADPPRVVLAAGSERMLTHPVLRGLEGLRYERLESDLLWGGGPTIPRAAARLAAIRDAIG